MATSSTSVTAGEIMDRSATLMNDPFKTDYTYDVLLPFLRMALDELTENLVDSQSSPTVVTSASSPITIIKGANGIFPIDANIAGASAFYPPNLVEIQEIKERLLGSDGPYIPMRRVEYAPVRPPMDSLGEWAWETQFIAFNRNGANTPRQVILNYIRDFSSTTVQPESIVGSISSRSYLSYKTAAYAAMFIGENKERAEVLEIQAEKSLERIQSINNKGRQQIMTRHRPFRATFKMRGGF